MFNEIIVQSIMSICIFNLSTTMCIFVNCKGTPNGNGNNIKVIFQPCIIFIFYDHVVHDHTCIQNVNNNISNFIACMGFEQLHTYFEKPQNCVLHPCTLPLIFEFFTLKFMHNWHKNQPSWIDAINKIIFWLTIFIHLKFKVDICTMQQVRHQLRPIQNI
jgi:hypothetical protein